MVSGMNRRRDCGSGDHFDFGAFLNDRDVVMELATLRCLEQREDLHGQPYFCALADADEVTDRGMAAFGGLGDMLVLSRVDQVKHEILHPVVARQRALEREDFNVRVIDRDMANLLVH